MAVRIHPKQKWCRCFGETRQVHCISMKELKWILGKDDVEELYEYKNLGVVKNYWFLFL